MKGLFLVVATLLVSHVYASEAKRMENPYYDLTSQVQEVPVEASTVLMVQQMVGQHPAPLTPIHSNGPDASGITDIINIGFKIWQIIEANKPVVNIAMPRASALPIGFKDWSEMESWSDIQVREYQVSYYNVYKMEVVRMNVFVTYSYGGTYNGRGSYISQVGVFLKDLSVSWGFTVNASTEVARTVNVGTRENPQALMEMNFTWSVSSIMKQIHEGLNFSIQGNGELRVY